jgi:hypothetical protein
MDPRLGCNLPLVRKLDHVYGRRLAAFLTRSAFQRRFKLPDRRIPRTAYGIERKAGPGLTALTLDLEPAQPTIEALRDRWGWLHRPAVPLHPDRPGFGLGAIGFANRFLRLFAGVLSADLGARYPGAKEDLARFHAHDGALQRPLRAQAMPLGSDDRYGLAASKVVARQRSGAHGMK